MGGPIAFPAVHQISYMAAESTSNPSEISLKIKLLGDYVCSYLSCPAAVAAPQPSVLCSDRTPG